MDNELVGQVVRVLSDAASREPLPVSTAVAVLTTALRRVTVGPILSQGNSLIEVRLYLLNEMLDAFATDLPPLTDAEVQRLLDTHRAAPVEVSGWFQTLLDQGMFRDAHRT